MIIDEVNRNVRVNGLGESVKFGIRKEDMAFVTGLLTDKLYSDKPMAVIREYICNAIDANRNNKYGKNILIDVPSSIDPTFSVRDFGAGLSYQDVTEIYVSLGMSTKRNSNEMIGAFGIGCKAAFAYTDSFNITSWYQGKCYTYTAQKNKNSELDLIPVGEFPSDEPSGIKISVSVNQNDMNSFVEKIKEFCAYLDVGVDFNDPEFKVNKPNVMADTDDYLIIKNENSRYGYSRNDIRALMGNIVYPVDAFQLLEKNRNFRNIILKFGLGEIDISPDREKLEYTKKTIASINDKIETLTKSIKVDVQSNIDKQKYLNDANDVIRTFNNSISFDISLSDYTFRGNPIPSDVIKLNTYYKKTSYRSNSAVRYNNSINNYSTSLISDEVVLVKLNPSEKFYAKRFADGYNKKYGFYPKHIVLTDDAKHHEILMIDCWNPDNVITDYKSLYEKRSVVRNSYSTNEVYVYRNMDRRESRTISSLSSYNEIPYVVVESVADFAVSDKDDEKYVKAAKQLHIDFYAISKNRKKYINNTFVPLKQHIREYFKEQISVLNRNEVNTINHVLKKFESLHDFNSIGGFLENHMSCLEKVGEKDIVENYLKYRKILSNRYQYESIINVGKMIGMNIDLGENKSLSDSIDDILKFSKKYSFPIKVYDHTYYVEKFKKDVSDYILMINQKA
jgi:hypothetical protein